MDRRDFLKTSAVIGAGMALGGTRAQAYYSRPANRLGPPQGNRVVVVGGGWGGVTAARHLARANVGAEIVLVEPHEFFISCPLSNLFLAGIKPLDYFTFDYKNVVRDGVNFINDRVYEIDRDKRQIRVGEGLIGYDYLVLAPGISYIPDSIPGYQEYQAQIPVGFRPQEHVALRRELEQFSGGNLVIRVPNPPYRCPPAPYERASLFAWYLKENQIPGRVIILDPNPEPVAKPKGFLAAFGELYPDIIEYRPNTQVAGLDHERKSVSTNSGELDYALINPIPDMRAHPLVEVTGLGERWGLVRPPHFVSQADPRVYLIGDIVGNMPAPKSGAIAHAEASIVAREIAARIQRRSPEELPVELPTGSCYSFVNQEEAIWVTAELTLDQVTGEVKNVISSDQNRSVQSGQVAYAWAQGVWADMFGG